MNLLRALAGLSLLLSLSVWLAIAGNYKIILSPSVPMGLWHVGKLNRPLRRGDFVWFCPPDTLLFRQARERGYLQPGDCLGNYLHLMKPVVAIAGDTVQVGKEGVRVNGKLLANSFPLSSDAQGRLLNHKQGCFRVQSGALWVISSFHKHSYDSRYFGPILLKQIVGNAQKL